MQVNSIKGFSPKFEKRYVEKTNMSAEQKDLYEEYIEPKLYSDSFSKISHKLDDAGVDVYVKPFKENDLKIILKKGDAVYKDSDEKAVASYFYHDLPEYIAQSFSDFRVKALKVSRQEKAKEFVELEEAQQKPFEDEFDAGEIEIEGEELPQISFNEFKKAEEAFSNDLVNDIGEKE